MCSKSWKRLAAAKETFDIVIAVRRLSCARARTWNPVPRAYRKLGVWRPPSLRRGDFCFGVMLAQYFAGAFRRRMRRRHRACEPPMRMIRRPAQARTIRFIRCCRETAYLKANVYALD